MMIYVASPYSHPDPSVRELRYKLAMHAVHRLMLQGHRVVYSPIVASHPIATMFDLPGGFDFWKDQDRWFIEHASKIVVLKIAGWENSHGVRVEMQWANELGKPIEFMEMP